ncbi:MAG: hypothetical protein JNG90_09085, partial [Planctomycetaceae bacterium]|nr:hypothetical protein [Planctomycetaceae bacterium]
MIGRREFGLAGVSALAAAAAPRLASAQQRDAPHHGHAGAMMTCAMACNDCQRECDACAEHCAALLAEGHKSHLATLKSCQDCAEFCAAAARIAARQGPFAA